jgi:basic membrane protein A
MEARSRYGTAWPNGTVSMAPYTNMPDDVAKMALRPPPPSRLLASSIPSRARSPSRTEPLSMQTVDDGMILGMNWYVKGVDDKLPQ